MKSPHLYNKSPPRGQAAFPRPGIQAVKGASIALKCRRERLRGFESHPGLQNLKPRRQRELRLHPPTLRVTQAMAAGVTDRLWSIQNLLRA